MADVASLLAEFQKGIEGKDTGLGATVKFDFASVKKRVDLVELEP